MRRRDESEIDRRLGPRWSRWNGECWNGDHTVIVFGDERGQACWAAEGRLTLPKIARYTVIRAWLFDARWWIVENLMPTTPDRLTKGPLTLRLERAGWRWDERTSGAAHILTGVPHTVIGLEAERNAHPTNRIQVFTAACFAKEGMHDIPDFALQAVYAAWQVDAQDHVVRTLFEGQGSSVGEIPEDFAPDKLPRLWI